MNDPITVLLVGDQLTDAKMATDMLRQAGGDQIKLTHVERLSTALGRLGGSTFDVILLDLNLLVTHGIDTFRQLQAAVPRVPIVLLSGPNEETLAIQALRHGAQDFLLKERWSGELLVHAVRNSVERKRAEETLTYLPQFDQLTALANRTLFQDRLTLAIARGKRQAEGLSVMLLGLDRFRTINDNLGHESGDALLRVAAYRLKSCLREVDTVSRLEGDEFAIVLEGTAKESGIVTVATRLLTAIGEPFELPGHQANVTASLGVTVYPVDGRTTGELLKSVRIAMDRAKERGGNQCQLFKSDVG